MTLNDLPTPCAVLDEPRLARNIARMQARMDSLGVAFRPHVKTSKCIAVAQRQQAAGAHGITVSTLKEAEQFFAAGFADILYAVAIAPHKIAQALALMQQGCRLQLVVDAAAAVQALAAAVRAAALPAPVPVLIEIDVDGHRGGVAPDAALLPALGRLIADSPGLVLHGVMAHAGSSYDMHTPQALAQVAEQERARSVAAAQVLRDAGLPCPVVSIGSTPTALSAVQLGGITEVRAGVYVFFDLVMAGVGVCTPDDVALSVLTTVIGHQAERGWVMVDAGWMAMSRDRGTQAQAVDQRYGLVCDIEGRPLPGLVLAAANQEHGIVALRDDAAAAADPAGPATLAARLPIGTRLRILPNHACATGAQHERYHLVDGLQQRADWPRFGGW